MSAVSVIAIPAMSKRTRLACQCASAILLVMLSFGPAWCQEGDEQKPFTEAEMFKQLYEEIMVKQRIGGDGDPLADQPGLTAEQIRAAKEQQKAATEQRIKSELDDIIVPEVTQSRKIINIGNGSNEAQRELIDQGLIDKNFIILQQ